MNEKTPSGKNGQRGFEYTGEFWLARASFFPFFFLLFSLSSSTSHFFFLLHRRRRSQRRRGTSHGKSKTLWEEETFFSQSREFDSIKIESSLLFFSIFFSRSTQRDLYTKKESLTSFLLKTKNTYAIRNTRFSRQAKYSFGSVSRRPDMNVGEAMAASGNVSFRFTLRF